MKTFSLTELNKRPGSVIGAAAASPITLTKAGRPRYVVMSMEEYEKRLVRGNPQHALRWDETPPELADAFAGALDDIIDESISEPKGNDDGERRSADLREIERY